MTPTPEDLVYEGFRSIENWNHWRKAARESFSLYCSLPGSKSLPECSAPQCIGPEFWELILRYMMAYTSDPENPYMHLRVLWDVGEVASVPAVLVLGVRKDHSVRIHLVNQTRFTDLASQTGNRIRAAGGRADSPDVARELLRDPEAMRACNFWGGEQEADNED